MQGGGAERVASIIGNYYVEQGHQVYYFLGKQRDKIAYDIKGKIIHTEVNYGIQDMRTLFKAAHMMRQYKKKYQIDVSISFMEEFNYLNVLSKGRDKVITRICTIISQREELKGTFLYQKWMLSLFYNLSGKVVVMTHFAKEEMIHKYGIRKNKIVIIPNPLQDMKNDVMEKVWKYGNNVILCVGRLENVKQHNVAIRAFSKVVVNIPNAKLLILGTGPNLNKLKKLISELQLEKSAFLLGFHKDTLYYLTHAKVFLMTSKTESFGNAMTEAMNVGIPTISTEQPAAVEILGGKQKVEDGIEYRKYGVTVPHIDCDYLWREPLTKEEVILSEAIINMLENEKLREKYSRLGQKRAEKYSLDRIMDRWNKVINGR